MTPQNTASDQGVPVCQSSRTHSDTVERQWLENLWDPRNLFEVWVVRAPEGQLWRQIRKQIAINVGKSFTQ